MDSVVVIQSPGLGISLGPDAGICTGDSIQLTVNGIPNNSTISWLPTTGLSCSNCANPYAKPSSSVVYSVTVTNQYGCTGADSILINVTANGTASVYPVDTAICNYDFIQLHASGGDSYSWSPATYLYGANTADPFMNPNDTAIKSDLLITYTVTASMPGCSATTATASITVYPYLSVPAIVQSHDTLYCSYNPKYIQYQWYDDSVIVPGATHPYFVINKGGNYNVSVFDIHGCSIAVGINIIFASVIGSREEEAVTLLYNPTGMIHIKFLYPGTWNLGIYNAIGQLTQRQIMPAMNEIVDVSSLARGIYIIVFQDNNSGKSFRMKFVRE
jgi:hypothetical protein